MSSCRASSAETDAGDRRQSLRQRSVARAAGTTRNRIDRAASRQPQETGDARWPSTAAVPASLDRRTHQRLARKLPPLGGALRPLAHDLSRVLSYRLLHDRLTEGCAIATQPSANPKNLFAFLLGMLTLTQGLVLPTESLLLRRAAKVQKRNQFPIANGFTGPLQKARCHEEVLLESPTRPARHQTPVSSKRAARSDLDAAISPLLSPVSLPCFLGCGGEVSQPYFILWSTLRAQLFPDAEIVARKLAQRPT